MDLIALMLFQLFALFHKASVDLFRPVVVGIGVFPTERDQSPKLNPKKNH